MKTNKLSHNKIYSVTKKILLIVTCILILIILFLVMMMLLGYKFNKQFISFNRNECIEKEYPTYNQHSGIQGCIFWMRHDYLEKTQSWQTLFERDDAYCDLKYGNEKLSGIEKLFSAENADPKCSYPAFQKEKRDENWDYLVSKEKDGFYDYCADQICPRQSLFK